MLQIKIIPDDFQQINDLQQTNNNVIELTPLVQDQISIDINLIRNNTINERAMVREHSVIALIIFAITVGIELYWYAGWVVDADSSTYFWLRIFFFPIIFLLSSFFVSIIVNSVFNLLLPASWITQNSKHYSHTPPLFIPNTLPCVTIQIPVYKESFEEVAKLKNDGNEVCRENMNRWFDNIAIMSDMQCGTGGLYGSNPAEYNEYRVNNGNHINVLKLIQKYRELINPKVNVYCVQVAGYNNSLVPEMMYRTHLLSGWCGNESIFMKKMNEMMDEMDKNN